MQVVALLLHNNDSGRSSNINQQQQHRVQGLPLQHLWQLCDVFPLYLLRRKIWWNHRIENAAFVLKSKKGKGIHSFFYVVVAFSLSHLIHSVLLKNNHRNADTIYTTRSFDCPALIFITTSAFWTGWAGTVPVPRVATKCPRTIPCTKRVVANG